VTLVRSQITDGQGNPPAHGSASATVEAKSFTQPGPIWISGVEYAGVLQMVLDDQGYWQRDLAPNSPTDFYRVTQWCDGRAVVTDIRVPATGGPYGLRDIEDTVATYYGASGTFGGIDLLLKLPTGQTVRTVPVASWAFGDGHSIGWVAVMSDGQVVMPGSWFNGSGLISSSIDCSYCTFDPATATFARVVIPTTTGDTSVLEDGLTVGGANIVMAVAAAISGVEHVIFCGANPYPGGNGAGWQIGAPANNGLYYGLPSGKKVAGSWVFDSAKSWTTDAMHASSSAGATAFPAGGTNPHGETWYSNRIAAQIAVLPASGMVVMTEYFSDGTNSHIVVIDPATGVVQADFTVPSTPGGLGGHDPRDVKACPTSLINAEEFCVTYDDWIGGHTAPNYTAQLFSYNHSTKTVTALSSAFMAQADAKMGAAGYSSDGDLMFSQAKSVGFGSKPQVAYARDANGQLAPARTAWSGAPFGTVIPPDISIAMPAGITAPWGGPIQDPTTKAMFQVDLNGVVVPLLLSGSGSSLAIKLGTPVDLGLAGYLRQSYRGTILPFVGCVDDDLRRLWIPIAQTGDPNKSLGSYPAGTTTWQPSHAYAGGEYVIPTDANGHYYQVSGSGTSGTIEPTWPTDGTCTADPTIGGPNYCDQGAPAGYSLPAWLVALNPDRIVRPV
jgi:hypothetical protein